MVSQHQYRNAVDVAREQLRSRRRLVRHWASGMVVGLQGQEVVHLLHIYKTGGTALKRALNSVGCTRRFRFFTHKHSVTLRSVPRGQQFIVFVRDPVDRFVSGFYCRHRQGRPTYFTPWSEAEAVTFARYASPNEIGEALSAGRGEARLARDAMQSLDRMITPFSHWLGPQDYLRSRIDDLLLVGRQETL